MSDVCVGCKRKHTIVVDYKQGREVCTYCGVVASGIVLDERFGGQDHRQFDDGPVRVPRNQQVDHTFMPSYYELTDKDTMKTNTTEFKRFERYEDGFKQLEMFGTRLAMTRYALDTAKRMFSKLRESRRKLLFVEAWLAAILYRAGLIWKDHPISLHRICRVMRLFSRDDMKEVRRRVRRFEQALPPKQFSEFTLVPEQQQVESFVRAFIRKLHRPKWENACMQQVKMYFGYRHEETSTTPQLPEVLAAATLFRMYREARRRCPEKTHLYDYRKLALLLGMPEDTVRACEAKMPIMDPRQHAANKLVLQKLALQTSHKKKI